MTQYPTDTKSIRIKAILKRRELTFVCLLSMMMGCSSHDPQKKEFRPTLQILNSRSRDPRQLARQIIQSLPAGAGRARVLQSRLQNIFHPRVRARILFPLYDELQSDSELLEVYFDHFGEQPPKKIDQDFLATAASSTEHFSEFVEIWLKVYPFKGAPIIQKELASRQTLSTLEMLQLSEALFQRGDFARAALALAKTMPLLEGSSQNRAEFLNGRLDFFQKDFESAVEKLKPLMMEPAYQDESIAMLVDSLILLKDLKRAFRYLKVYGTYKDARSPMLYILQSKLFLFSRNYRESLKQWELARELGVKGQQFGLQAFFLSHYFPKRRSVSAAAFPDWKRGKVRRSGIGLVQADIWLDQYALLSRHDEELLAGLKASIHPTL